MRTVTVTKDIEAPTDEVAAVLNDVEPFMRAAGFDEVSVDGDTLHLANEVGPVRIELALAVVESSATVFEYEQVDGIFETMTTRYELTETETGTRATATTDFAVDAALVGAVLDATVIKRQRTRELTAQFDYVEDRVSG